MDRKEFLKSSTLCEAAALVPYTNSFAKNLAYNSIDKFVDANRNYMQYTLPYSNQVES